VASPGWPHAASATSSRPRHKKGLAASACITNAATESMPLRKSGRTDDGQDLAQRVKVDRALNPHASPADLDLDHSWWDTGRLN
jgi:hypothetical protein